MNIIISGFRIIKCYLHYYLIFFIFIFFSAIPRPFIKFPVCFKGIINIFLISDEYTRYTFTRESPSPPPPHPGVTQPRSQGPHRFFFFFALFGWGAKGEGPENEVRGYRYYYLIFFISSFFSAMLPLPQLRFVR